MSQYTPKKATKKIKKICILRIKGSSHGGKVWQISAAFIQNTAPTYPNVYMEGTEAEIAHNEISIGSMRKTGSEMNLSYDWHVPLRLSGPTSICNPPTSHIWCIHCFTSKSWRLVWMKSEMQKLGEKFFSLPFFLSCKEIITWGTSYSPGKKLG